MLGDVTLMNAINTMPRKLSCKLDAGNSNVITNVKRLTYATDWSGSIAVGQVVSSYINVTVPTPSFSIAGVNVALSMGVGTTVTWTKIGDFRIDEESVRTKQGYTSFSAFDKLYNTINTYHSSGNKTLQAICNEVCSLIGITSTTLSADLTIDSEMLDGYTLRDVLGFIAAYQGKNAYLSPNGVLEMRWFSSSAYTADGTKANIPYIGENDCTIRRWICQTQDGVLTSGSGEGLYFTCPFMTQARLNDLATYQQLTAYRKAEVDIPFGNYLLQAGDIITVTTTGSNLTVPIMSNSWTYDGGVASSVSSYGATDYTGTANNAELSISAARVQSVLDSKRAAYRVTEEIEIATAHITGASGGYIKINFGGNGKTAELLVMDQPSYEQSRNVWIFNQNGLGHIHRESTSDPFDPVNIALTSYGTIIADRVSSGRISSNVEFENTVGNRQTLISDGCYEINNVYNDIVSAVGRIIYKGRTSYYSNDTLAIEVEHGKDITIGETDSAKFVFHSAPDSSQGVEMFHIYGNIRAFDDILLQNMYDPNNHGKSLLDKIQELEQRIEALENA